MKKGMIGLLVLAAMATPALAQNAPKPGRVVGAARKGAREPLKGALDTESMARIVCDLVNAERRSQGLPPLVLSPELSELARVYSRDMVERSYFDHVDPEGRRVGARVEQTTGIIWRSVGENIARNRGFDDPAEMAVRGWMQSQAHRENILSAKYAETGVGAWVAPDGTVYVTQIFLTRKK